MRYNLARTMAAVLKDSAAALDLLEPLFERLPLEMVNRAKSDPNIASVRGDPRFAAMTAKAEARLAQIKPAP